MTKQSLVLLHFLALFSLIAAIRGGNPVGAEILVTPVAGIEFGNVDRNGTKTSSFTVRNTGTTAVTGQARIQAGDSVFKLLDEEDIEVPLIAYSLQPGQTAQVQVQFIPNALQNFFATASFSDGADVTTRALSGRGAEPPDFSDVADVLEGQWRVIRVDDIVAGNGFDELREQWVFDMDLKIVVGATKTNVGSVLPPSQPDQSRMHVQIARMFNLPNGVIANYTPSEGSCAIFVQDQLDPSNNFQQSVGSRLDPTCDAIQSVVGDFNLDGFDDIFFIGQQNAVIATAADQETYDIAGGIGFGPVAVTGAFGIAMNTPAAGDFNGDGLVNVAWVGGSTADGSQLAVHFATVCPGPVENTECAGAQEFEIVPANGFSPIPLQAKVQNGAALETNIPAVAITAGNFIGAPTSDQIVVVDSTPAQFIVKLYRFNGKAAVLEDSYSAAVTPASVLAASERLNWFGGGDQAAVGWSAKVNGNRIFDITTISFAPTTASTFRMVPQALRVNASFFTQRGLDINQMLLAGLTPGRFERRTRVEAAAFNLQLAAWFLSTSAQDSLLSVYSLTDPPNDLTPKVSSTFKFDSRAPQGTENRSGNLLSAGDLGGRSFRLGPPSVLRVPEDHQLISVLAKPPMHAAYVSPRLTDSQPFELMNFTAVMNDYFSKYKFTSSEQQSLERQETTSWTWGDADKVSGGLFLGSPATKDSPASGFIIEGQLAMETTEQDFIDARYNTYLGESFSFSAQTLGADILRYSQRRMNFYVYPVLGQTICPGDKPLCSSEEELPLLVIVSAPDQTEPTGLTEGTDVEWYQPPYEPFHALSYPWDEEQLELIYRGWQELGASSRVKTTNQNLQFSFNWSAGGGVNQKVGAAQQKQFDAGISISVGNPEYDKGKGLGQFTGAFQWNRSCATAQVITDTYALSESQGIDLAFPGSFKLPELFNYEVQGFLFGETPLPPEFDEVPVGVGRPEPRQCDTRPTEDKVVPNVNQQTHGTLQSGWTANPTVSSPGTWWEDGPYTEKFDIALNKPKRLTWIIETHSKIPFNCLAINPKDTNKTNCVRIWGPNSNTTLWSSQFYHMRGLFVTVDGTTGPQRGSAVEGQVVFLGARVHNLSVKDLPSDSKVVVRFYRQQIDGSKKPIGDSVLIDEVDLPPIPSFNSPIYQGLPNWDIARTTWDTTGFANTVWLFWVAVYAECTVDNCLPGLHAGEMLPELDYHGLATKPGNLTAINCKFSQGGPCTDPALESIDIESCLMAGDIAPCDPTRRTVTSVSNNVGYLKQEFVVLDADGTGSSAGATGQAVVENVAVELIPNDSPGPEPLQARLHQPVLITADIRAVTDVAGASVWFFEEEPDSETLAVDVENVAFIRANETERVEVVHQPRECGLREIRVIVRGIEEEAVGTAMLDVACELELTADLGKVKRLRSAAANNTFRLFFEFDTEEDADLRRTQLTLLSLLSEPGQTELVRDDSGDAIAPRVLHRTNSAKVNKAKFKATAGKTRVKAKLKKVGDKRVRGEFEVKKAAILTPECQGDAPSTTFLETSFTVNDQVNAPVIVRVLDEWECVRAKNGEVRKLKSRS